MIFRGRFKSIFISSFLGAITILTVRLYAASGDSHWDRQFGLPGVTNRVYALRFNGDKLYASGYAVGAGGLVSTNTGVDIFDGTNWSSTIGELSGSLGYVFDVVVIGNNTYVGGIFTKAGGVTAVGLAKWDGAQWSDVGGLSAAIGSLASDGTNLYASGTFTNAGGVLMTNIGKWNGTSWSGLGSASGSSGTLEWNHGRLYLAGSFTNVGTIAATNLAVWNGSTWSQFGGGVNGSVGNMAFDGDNLYIGGSFTSAGGVAAMGIAKWDGNSWSPLGTGVKGGISCIGVLGTDVYVGGGFTNVGGVNARSFAKWDGGSWTTYPITDGVFQYPLNDTANRMLVKDGSLYVGGNFNQAGDVIANHVARYDGNIFYALGEKPANGFATPPINVSCIGQAKDGVYVGGLFTAAGRTLANRIARWDGTNWFDVGGGTMGGSSSANRVLAIAGRGSDVFVGGTFTGVGGISVSNVAKWNSFFWESMGVGFDATVSVLAASPGAVYAGGSFTNANNGFSIVTVNHIAMWDGFQWNNLGFGMNGNVNAIAVDANGNVFAGGSFTTADLTTANRIAMWNGSSWSSLGSGSSNGVSAAVSAIAINGSDVYVGGSFTNAGGQVVRGIAKWNGANWSGLGSGVTGVNAATVNALAFANGRLYCSGRFTNISGVNASSIARWDGTKWEPLGSGFFADSAIVRGSGLAIRGDDVYTVGTFAAAGLTESSGIARWNETVDFTPSSFTLNFSRTQLLPGKLFTTRINSSERATYVIEYSDDFQNWTPLMTNTASQLDFTNTVSLPVSRRIFRAKGIP